MVTEKIIKGILLLTAVGLCGGSIETVNSLNLEQYAGSWYQMYSDLAVSRSYQRHGLCVKVYYELKDNMTLSMRETFRTDSPFGRAVEINGDIIQPSVVTPGKLQKKVKIIPYATPYLVIKLGPVDPDVNLYQYAIVTDINKGVLYIYARDKHEFKRSFEHEALAFCENNGFNNYDNKPIETPQPPVCRYD